MVTTSTTIPGPTTTTLPLEAQCDGLVGVARASCVIRAALAEGLCGDERIPTKLDGALRRRLGVAADKLDAAVTETCRKRTRLLKNSCRRALTTVERQAGVAARSKRASKRISSSCEGNIGGLVGTTRAGPVVIR